MELSELQKQSWKTAEEKGFHAAQEVLPPKTLATYLRLLLTIGELSEAAEELRDGRGVTEIYYEHAVAKGSPSEKKVINDKPWMIRDTNDSSQTGYTWHAEKPEMLGTKNQLLVMGKPCGFPVELADALIRLLDLSEECGVDLSEVAELKAAYNRSRERMHGKTA